MRENKSARNCITDYYIKT